MDLDSVGAGARIRPTVDGAAAERGLPSSRPVEPQAAASALGNRLPEARQEAVSFREQLEDAAERLEDFVREAGRELEFRVGDGSGNGGNVVIVVRQSGSGEILRTIPPDEALRLARDLGSGGGALFSGLA